MSDIIHLLPDSVANQIAAGEVIQRPASLIKELVENSLDAGASHVQVIVTDAGKTCVQVIDNGKGMSETDARLSFERHATSKITTANDLFALTTMGFRGEALASIAAVAQVELRTRMADEELGVSIQVEGSKFINQEPIACPVGANFLVKNLFFNVPARRKFLKSNHTELSNIIAEFERIALAHPDISFSLSTPDSTLLELPAGNFRQRIVNIFGRKLDKLLIPVQVETPLAGITGFVGNLESSKKKGAQQFFFCNGRYMRHPYFAKAIQSAFDRLLPEGEQVPFFIQFIVEPSKIDVNIHPTKTEIKFEDEQSIWQILRAAIRESLGKFNAIPTIDFDTENLPDIPTFDGTASPIKMPEISVDLSFNPFETTTFSSDEKPTVHQSQSVSGYRSGDSAKGWEKLYAETFSDSSYSQENSCPTVSSPKPVNDSTKEAPLYADLDSSQRQAWESATAQYLQYKGRYILSPTEQGMLIVDQHRAHLRILYDQYIEQIRLRTPQSQGLLFPQIIELSPIQAATLQSIEPELSALGFELSFLGGGSYSILGIPSGVDGIDPVVLLQTIVDEAMLNPTDIHEEITTTIALSLARKAAIPIGQELSNEEMRDLVVQLLSRTSPTFTPDGKSTLSILPHSTITKSFD